MILLYENQNQKHFERRFNFHAVKISKRCICSCPIGCLPNSNVVALLFKGLHLKKTLKWLHEAEQERATKIVSKRVDEFRERSQEQLGQVHDP